MSMRTAAWFGWAAAAVLWTADGAGAQQPQTSSGGTGGTGTLQKLGTGTPALGARPTTSGTTGTMGTTAPGGFGSSGRSFGSGFGSGQSGFALPRLSRDQELALLTEAMQLADVLISDLNIQFSSEYEALMFLLRVYEITYLSALMEQMSAGQNATGMGSFGGLSTGGFGSGTGTGTGTTGTTTGGTGPTTTGTTRLTGPKKANTKP